MIELMGLIRSSLQRQMDLADEGPGTLLALGSRALPWLQEKQSPAAAKQQLSAATDRECSSRRKRSSQASVRRVVELRPQCPVPVTRKQPPVPAPRLWLQVKDPEGATSLTEAREKLA